jgi:nucleotide-binding universal stress UspA family protein
MTYKTILVQLDIDQPATPRTAFAWALAKRFGAELIAFCACQPQQVMSAGEGAMVGDVLMRRQIEEIEARFRDLKEEVRQATEDNALVSWRGLVEMPTRSLLEQARAADLIVTGTVGPEFFRNTHRTIDPGELILAAGRPVLFANIRLAPLTAERAVVSWKDTREARRAIADAMPFLVGAKEVVVATAQEGDPTEARASLADVVGHLTRHGVKARSEILFPVDGEIGLAVSSAAFELGADLVVSGGYGHSRLREWTFGGVTRSLLHDGSLNRLFSN